MSHDTQVRWQELLPREFVARRDARPIVWMPMGICEPHGHVAAFGLDTIKADYLCDESARREGGVVAPTQGYHVHETGPHAPWLREVVGDVNPLLAAVPPDIVLRLLVFQLRAFRNAGFRLAMVVTGHNGNQDDLRLASEEFTRRSPMKVVAKSDPELVAGTFEGDHAGRYEVSQLLHIRPDLVDLSRLDDGATSSLERFAQGFDVAESTAERGKEILDLSLDVLKGLADDADVPEGPLEGFMTLDEAEEVWEAVASRRDEWITLKD